MTTTIYPHVVIDDLRFFTNEPDPCPIYLRNYKMAETWIDNQVELLAKAAGSVIIIENLYMDFDLGDFSCPDQLLDKLAQHKQIQVDDCHIVTMNPVGQQRLLMSAKPLVHGHTTIDPGGRRHGLQGGY